MISSDQDTNIFTGQETNIVTGQDTNIVTIDTDQDTIVLSSEDDSFAKINQYLLKRESHAFSKLSDHQDNFIENFLPTFKKLNLAERLNLSDPSEISSSDESSDYPVKSIVKPIPSVKFLKICKKLIEILILGKDKDKDKSIDVLSKMKSKLEDDNSRTKINSLLESACVFFERTGIECLKERLLESNKKAI